MTVGLSILNENLYRCEWNDAGVSSLTRDKSTTSYLPGQNGSNYNRLTELMRKVFGIQKYHYMYSTCIIMMIIIIKAHTIHCITLILHVITTCTCISCTLYMYMYCSILTYCTRGVIIRWLYLYSCISLNLSICSNRSEQ